MNARDRSLEQESDDDLKPEKSDSSDSCISQSVEKRLRKSNMMRLNKKRTTNSIKAMSNLRNDYIKWYDNGEG